MVFKTFIQQAFQRVQRHFSKCPARNPSRGWPARCGRRGRCSVSGEQPTQSGECGVLTSSPDATTRRFLEPSAPHLPPGTDRPRSSDQIILHGWTRVGAKKDREEPMTALKTVILSLLVAETQASVKFFDKDAFAIKAAQDKAQTSTSSTRSGTTALEAGGGQGQEGIRDRGSHVNPDGAGKCMQGQCHHQVQRRPKDEKGTRKQRQGGLHSGGIPQVPRRSRSTGAPQQVNKQRSLGLGGDAIASTHPKETWSRHGTSEGAGGRLDQPAP